MKRFILIQTLVVLSFTLFSQTFSILDGSKNNVSNSQFTVSGEINTVIKGQLYVVNTSSSSASFKVKKIEVSVQSGTLNTFCFNEQCYPPHVTETTGSMSISAGDTTASSGFYGEYTPNIVTGSSIITYVVINANDLNDSTYVTVTYNALPASIPNNDFSKVEFSNPYPNPVILNTKINYNIPFVYNRATLVIRNIIGTTVKEFEISTPQGRLNLDLSDLNEGIYFYSLIVDGNIVLTRKLIKK